MDRLYSVYPLSTNIRRNIDPDKLSRLKQYYMDRDNLNLLKETLSLDLFPIKDSYVAYLKKVPNALELNPQTVNRISGIMYEMEWDKFVHNITEPKETNRQMSNRFSDWLINKQPFGIKPVTLDVFMSNTENAILDASDIQMKNFAKEKFNYTHNKGLDFIARFNNKYVIGEAKFLTDFGGHQNAQLSDALQTLNTNVNGAIVIAILDGIIWATTNNKMYKTITSDEYKDKYILSALLLRDFLFSL